MENMVNVLSYIYEYGALKHVEVILRRGRGRGRIMEVMSQTGLHCIHVWKCHNKIPCTANIYNKIIKKKKKRNGVRDMSTNWLKI
jgi:hypothetical protein